MVQPIRPFVQGTRQSGSAPRLPRLEIIERKSDVLRPSSLACLGRSYDATINLTQGCPHGCVYCYARGYRNYPGDDRVLLYGNTVEKLRQELLRKRRLPETVYFSPSSDAFGPYRLLQRMTYEAMQSAAGSRPARLAVDQGLHLAAVLPPVAAIPGRGPRPDRPEYPQPGDRPLARAAGRYAAAQAHQHRPPAGQRRGCDRAASTRSFPTSRIRPSR